jgi:hypothetical protein
MLVARDFQRRLDSDLAARGILGIRHRHNDVFLYLGRNGPSRGVDLASAAGTSVDDENHSGVGAAGTGRTQA